MGRGQTHSEGGQGREMRSISIGLAVLVLAISMGIASFLARKSKKRVTVFAISLLASVSIIGVVALHTVFPAIAEWRDRHEVETSLRERRAYQLIASLDPMSHQLIRTDLRHLLESGVGKSQVIEQGQKAIFDVTRTYFLHASDDAIVQYTLAMAQEIEELADLDPELCYHFLFPEHLGMPDPKRTLKPEAQRKDLLALSEVIRTATTEPQIAPDVEDSRRHLETVLRDFYRVHGEEALLLRTPFAPGIDKSNVSRLTASFYRQVLELPKKQSSLVLRYILSAEK